MKLAELLQGRKPSPSSMPRAGRGGAVEGKPSDFAGALTEARKKPEPKPTDADAPVAKKPSAERKSKAAKDEQAPAEDVVAAEEAVDTDQSQPTAVDETPIAEDAAPQVDDDAEAPAETEEAAVDANVNLIAMAQATGPQLPAAAELPAETDGVEYTEADGQMICPPKWNHLAQSPVVVEDQGESEAPDGESTVAEALLKGFDDIVGEESEPPPGDIAFDADASEAPVAKALPKQAAAPVAPVDAAEPIELETPKANDAADAKTSALSSEFAQDADAPVTEDGPVAAANIAGDAGGSSASTTSGHVQPEAAKPQATAQAPAAPAPAPPPPQAHFAEVNHPKIVTAVQSQALTNGGTMQIRLDPPELGALQVMVHMQDGVMTASFHTSNDDATKLLSHSLSQLKQVLESQGVSVERLQVSQAPKDQHAQNDDPRQSPRDQHDDAHRQEQQRKEMLRRMWRRLSNGSDPLDLVA
jgi:flagellar hook-length control protein FliK